MGTRRPVKKKENNYLNIFGFGVFEYYFRIDIGRMIVLRYQEYDVPGLPNYLRIIYPQGICTSEGCKVTFVYNYYDENDRYVELNLK